MIIGVMHRSPVIARSLCLLLSDEEQDATDIEWSGLANLTATLGTLSPDVLLADPTIEGLDVQAMVKAVQDNSETSVSLFAIDGTADQLGEAASAGAHGYISLNTPIDEFLASVQLLATGNAVATSDTSTTLADIVNESNELESSVSELTPREREITELVASGMTNKAMARRLDLSASTVTVHLRNIFRKIGISNRTELTGYAHRSRIV